MVLPNMAVFNTGNRLRIKTRANNKANSKFFCHHIYRPKLTQFSSYPPQQDYRDQSAYPPQQNQYPGSAPSNQFPQQGAYNQAPHPIDNNVPGQMAPTDPSMQQEGDRGILGAIAGGSAGYYGGNKAGGHGILGALAGAFAGHKLEDKFKGKNGHGKKW